MCLFSSFCSYQITCCQSSIVKVQATIYKKNRIRCKGKQIEINPTLKDRTMKQDRFQGSRIFELFTKCVPWQIDATKILCTKPIFILIAHRLLNSIVVECWHRVREVPGSIPSQGPRHKTLQKWYQVVPLFSTEH